MAGASSRPAHVGLSVCEGFPSCRMQTATSPPKQRWRRAAPSFSCWSAVRCCGRHAWQAWRACLYERSPRQRCQGRMRGPTHVPSLSLPPPSPSLCPTPAVAYFGFLLSTISSLLDNQSLAARTSAAIQDRLLEVEGWMEGQGLPPTLQREIRWFYTCSWAPALGEAAAGALLHCRLGVCCGWSCSRVGSTAESRLVSHRRSALPRRARHASPV